MDRLLPYYRILHFTELIFCDGVFNFCLLESYRIISSHPFLLDLWFIAQISRSNVTLNQIMIDNCTKLNYSGS